MQLPHPPGALKGLGRCTTPCTTQTGLSLSPTSRNLCGSRAPVHHLANFTDRNVTSGRDGTSLSTLHTDQACAQVETAPPRAGSRAFRSRPAQPLRRGIGCQIACVIWTRDRQKTAVHGAWRPGHGFVYPHRHGHPDGVRGGWGDRVSSTPKSAAQPACQHCTPTARDPPVSRAPSHRCAVAGNPKAG